jgi:ATP-dependent RNA helicase DeaD
MVWLRRGRCSRERKIVAQLAADGYDPSEIAAIALKLARDKERQRPVAPIGQVPQNRLSQKKRPAAKRTRSGSARTRPVDSHEKGMVRLALNTGRAAGVEVKHIVGSLAHFADIPGRLLGRIDVEEQHSYVDVPGKLVAQVLAKTANYKIGRQAVTVERA